MIGIIVAISLMAAGIAYVVFELGNQLQAFVEGGEE